MRDKRGVVYVETLVGFLPVFVLFLGTVQLTDLSVAHLIVQHASTVAARAAAVVLPDDGSYYEDRDNAQLHTFAGARRLDVERAADLILRANPRLHANGPNVGLDKPTYAERDDLIATVRARYHCLIAPLCGSGLDLSAESKLVYQGAKYVYDLQGRALDGVFNRARRETERSISDNSDPRANERGGDPIYDGDAREPAEGSGRGGDRDDSRADRPPRETRPGERTDRPPREQQARTDDPDRSRDPTKDDRRGGPPRERGEGERTTPRDDRTKPELATGPTKPESVRPDDSKPDRANPAPTEQTPGAPPALADNRPAPRDQTPGASPPTPRGSPTPSRDGEGANPARGPPTDDGRNASSASAGVNLGKPREGDSARAPRDPRTGDRDPSEQPSSADVVARADGQGRRDDGLVRRDASGRLHLNVLNPQCFVAGTLIYTAQGDRPIESIRVGDLIWSRDDETGELALKPVTARFVTEDKPVLTVAIEGARAAEQLTVTERHPFWVEDAGWVDSDELRAGSRLWSPDGSLTSGAASDRGARATVYNLEVADFHTYFVGALHAWVHNQAQCNEEQAGEPAAQPAADPTADTSAAEARDDRRTRRAFRDQMRRTIAGQPNHPLQFLLENHPRNSNPRNRRFRVPPGQDRRHETLQGRSEDDITQPVTPGMRDDNPWYVEAGHGTSHHSGEPEFLGLQDAHENQQEGKQEGNQEASGVIYTRAFVEIGVPGPNGETIAGVPVEVRTARAWEEAGLLPPGTVDRSQRVAGWDVQQWQRAADERRARRGRRRR